LGERLSWQHADGEADVDDLAWKRVDRRARTLDDRHRPAELLGMSHPILDRVERPAVVEIGRPDGVAGVAQRGGEPADGVSEPECVVEDDDLRQARSISTRSALPPLLAREPGVN